MRGQRPRPPSPPQEGAGDSEYDRRSAKHTATNDKGRIKHELLAIGRVSANPGLVQQKATDEVNFHGRLDVNQLGRLVTTTPARRRFKFFI